MSGEMDVYPVLLTVKANAVGDTEQGIEERLIYDKGATVNPQLTVCMNDESLHGYGHEDTLFGYRLQQEGVPIVHIDNPAENGQVEQNAEFLDKTAEAVANLALLYRRLGTDHGFCQSVRLLKTYERLRRYRAVWLVAALFAVLKRPLRSHFVAGNAITVAQFNFYKLGLLIGCLRKG